MFVERNREVVLSVGQFGPFVVVGGIGAGSGAGGEMVFECTLIMKWSLVLCKQIFTTCRLGYLLIRKI